MYKWLIVVALLVASAACGGNGEVGMRAWAPPASETLECHAAVGKAEDIANGIYMSQVACTVVGGAYCGVTRVLELEYDQAKAEIVESCY